jgi:hypothetical protein
MAVAYTPGLRVSEDAVIRKQRRLPMKGEVLVRPGDRVAADDIVARAEMPGHLHTVRAGQMLRIEPQELESCLLKRPGDAVTRGELIGQTKGLWGLFKTELRSPISGTLEEFSSTSGHLRIREPSRSVEVRAHVGGRAQEVIAGEGAVIEARGALIQGIFGVGGERRGALRVTVDGPEAVLHSEDIGECEGCVLVAGAGAESAAIAAAAEAGAVGLIVGAVRDDTLREYVGYDIGIAITGQEDVRMTLILTEGFGQLAMARRTWDLLGSLEGQLASIDGTTQIRAGVMRPEVIVTREDGGAPGQENADRQVLVVGSRVRVIREPHFGALGGVIELPAELTEIETESKVRIAMVELDGGDEVRVPRANLELIEE